jgi:GTP cyclohydrolase I
MKLLKQANGNLPRTEAEKTKMVKEAAKHYGSFLTALGYDWKADPNSADTPNRYAKSFVDDIIFGSINPTPKVTAFPNSEGYDGIILQKDIRLVSMCSHHHREIKGLCHIAYIPGTESDSKVIGLSKLNRVANFYARRFQLQEALTQQIHEHISEVCEGNRGVAVIIEATHGCISCRQLYDSSTMVTSKLSGYFFTNEVGTRVELFNMLNKK